MKFSGLKTERSYLKQATYSSRYTGGCSRIIHRSSPKCSLTYHRWPLPTPWTNVLLSELTTLRRISADSSRSSCRGTRYVESLLLLSAVEINFAFCRQTNGLSKIYPPYHRLSSQVRLSHKYQMPSFLSLALQYLKRHFTTTFDEWTKVNYVPHPFTGVEAIGVVNIARHVGCDSILPTAFLACCNLDTDVLIGGFVCADGTREKLSEADLARCITGKIALLEELNAAVIRVCTTRENAMAECRCERAKPEVLRFFAEGKPRGACDPFLDCDTYLRLEARHGPRSTLSMCAKCRRTIAAQFREEQRDIWK